MRKKFRCGISFLVAAGMILSVCGENKGFEEVRYVSAAQEETGNQAVDFQYELSDGHVVITGYNGQDTDLTIPQEIDGNAVTGIAKEAFLSNADITGVVIPEGVTDIGYRAFYGCEHLRSVTIPSTITSWNEENMDNSAFEGCTGLTELNLAEGLASLGQKAFIGCTSLESVRVPSTIANFPSSVFEGCTSLQELELPEGIRQIGYHAFMGCSALREVHIPSTITSWPLIRANSVPIQTHENECFQDCTSLEEITFAEGLTTLKHFQGIKGCPLVKEVEIPGSVQDVTYAFKDCTGLESVVMKSGLPAIGEYAFYECTSLKRVTIADTVTKVELRAFYDDAALENLVFPRSVTQFGEAVSAGCENLKGCYIMADDVEWFQNPGLGKAGKLYCVPGSSTWDKYLAGMTERGRQDRMEPCPPIQGVEAEAYSAAYDGEEHDAVVLTGLREDDEVQYSLNGESCDGVPRIKEIGDYSVKVTVIRMSDGESGLPGVSSWTLEPQIGKEKKAQTLRLKDLVVRENEDYQVTPESFDGDGDIVYRYYEDEALTKELTGKPAAPGEYYVQGTVSETEEYAAAKSNVAKIVIVAEQTEVSPMPGATPGPQPSATPPGGAQPGLTPTPPTDIQPTVTVGKVTLKKVKATARRTLAISWKKTASVSGYEVWTATNKKFTKEKKTVLIKSGKTVTCKVKKLKSKKTYYVRVRAYRVVDGKRHYGAFSGVKKARVK